MLDLGRTGLKVAALCLGGNTFGRTTDQKVSEQVLNVYAEAGGNFIDTADVSRHADLSLIHAANGGSGGKATLARRVGSERTSKAVRLIRPGTMR